MTTWLEVLSTTLTNHGYNLLIISFLHLITWGYTLWIKGWVSDDLQGIAQFSDHFVQTKDQYGNIAKEEKIDSYETDRKDKDGKPIRIKNTAWPAYLGWPSCFLRWFRLNWGKSFRQIGTNQNGHKVYGWTQVSGKHHLLNVLTQWVNLALGYNLLNHLFGPEIALFSSIVFAVHPCQVQTVGWISGVNYLFSLLFSLLSFNLVIYVDNPYITLPLIAFFTLCSCATLLPGIFNFVILIMMHSYNEAIAAGLVGAYMLMSLGKFSVNLRVNAFKQQDMTKSTKIYFNKIIIMVKTFWYYVKLILFPKRLGLFHTWGYHFDEPLEHIDHEFWLGLGSIAAYFGFIWFAPFPVQFGLIWAFVYAIIFSNIITANQIVSERYTYYSLFGIAIALAYVLVVHPVIFAFLVGIAIMRVWVHLPTFQNEVRFYESNCFNFPESEVAMGNLGVSYMNHGMNNKCMDTWLEASRQNPLYDVPWYNLYQICKQNGDLNGAHRFLNMCLKAKTVHFKEQWTKEMEELKSILSRSGSIQDFSKKINKAITEGNYERTGK